MPPLKKTSVKKRLRLTDDELKTEMLKMWNNGERGKTHFYKTLQERVQIDNVRCSRMYEIVEKEASSAVISAQMDEIQGNAKEMAKNALLKQNEIAKQIQDEIEELQRMIKDGYILRKIVIPAQSETQEPTILEKEEVFGVWELEQLHKIVDRKRAELNKVLGYYSPTKTAITDTEGKDKDGVVINIIKRYAENEK